MVCITGSAGSGHRPCNCMCITRYSLCPSSPTGLSASVSPAFSHENSYLVSNETVLCSAYSRATLRLIPQRQNYLIVFFIAYRPEGNLSFGFHNSFVNTFLH